MVQETIDNPMIEFHTINDETILVNPDYIIRVLRGNHECFLEVEHLNAPIHVKESYEEIKTKLKAE